MRIVVSVFLAASAALASAQDSSPRPSDRSSARLITFTDPDGAFRFLYPDHLIVCQRMRNEAGGNLYWSPTKNCVAYHPVCDGLTPEKYTAVACLAYPRDEHTNTPRFEAATFSVEILDNAASAQSCLGKPPYENFAEKASLKINGIAFTAFKFSEAGMSQNTSGTLYRAFHRGRCYQIGVNLATSGAYEPPVPEMTKGDWDAVNQALEHARDSFEFVK